MLRSIYAAAFLAASSVTVSTAAYAEQKTAILAGGCFWCIEKDFDQVKGVINVVSGYTGGTLKNPTYKNHKGHREAVKVTYDSTKISYAQLLEVFWRTVDPTDAGGQFCDRGQSYTTAIYVENAKQKAVAEASKKEAQIALGKKIVTPIVNASFWTDSEGYHQNYAKKNPVRYRYYRFRCGRDKRVKALWGPQAYRGVDKTS